MANSPVTRHASNVEGNPDLTVFHTVDLSDEPAALIAFLQATDELPTFRVLKSAMLEELRLAHARTVLDVGCGVGADLVEMLERMPAGSTATGLDISETMISEGRRRAGPDARISFGLGNAMDLLYDDACFDCCRAETALQHVDDPQRAIGEMARVTRPGGRVAALEFDLGTAMVDHPDRQTTRLILDSWADDATNGWMGRQLPRMFRQAGLTDLLVKPQVVLVGLTMLRTLLGRHTERLAEQKMLAPAQFSLWWSQAERQASDSAVVAGATAFLVAATKP